MKKYIILIALTFIVTSCSKDNKKYCWKCQTKMKQIYPVEKPETYMRFEDCNKNSDQINDLLKQYPKIDTLKPNINGVERPELSTVQYMELTCAKQ